MTGVCLLTVSRSGDDVMDTDISNGDYAVNVQGYPSIIYGADEAAQLAGIVLSLQKGSFVYDRELGCDTFAYSTDENDLESMMIAAREALADRNDICVENVSIIENGNRYGLSFRISYEGEIREVGVRLNAQL